MAIADDFSVAVNGDIRHTSGSTHYTVLELHRFLQDLADNASSSGNDLLDITSITPSERSTDSIITLLGSYNIDDTAAQYFYGGSIKQGTGGTETLYSGLKVLGAVNNQDTQIEVIQNNAFYDTVAPFWGTQATGGYNGDAVSGILMRVLIKSRTSGADVDGKRCRVQARHWGDTFDFFNVTLGDSESVAAIGTTPDAQNTTSRSTVTAYTHVTNTQGLQTIDLANGNGPRQYYSKWTYGANTSGDGLKGVWEWVKDLTRNGTAKTIHNLGGEFFLGITHEVDYDTEASGPFVESETLSWGSGGTAGTGKLLALEDLGSTGTFWLQLLTGVAPADNAPITGLTSSATALANGAPLSRTVPKVFLGSYTGTLIGAFGVGVKATDLTVADSLQDLLGVTQTPPNNVVFTVTGLSTGVDYVLVGPKDTGSALKLDQFTLNTTLSSGSTSVVVTTAIPTDTPASGTIRVQTNTGNYKKTTYSSWSGSTFQLSGTFGDTATAPKNVFISYLDILATGGAESVSVLYLAPRNLWVRVRDGGTPPIKTFESPGAIGVNGGSVVVSRISDA